MSVSWWGRQWHLGQAASPTPATSFFFFSPPSFPLFFLSSPLSKRDGKPYHFLRSCSPLPLAMLIRICLLLPLCSFDFSQNNCKCSTQRKVVSSSPSFSRSLSYACLWLRSSARWLSSFDLSQNNCKCSAERSTPGDSSFLHFSSYLYPWLHLSAHQLSSFDFSQNDCKCSTEKPAPASFTASVTSTHHDAHPNVYYYHYPPSVLLWVAASAAQKNPRQATVQLRITDSSYLQP